MEKVILVGHSMGGLAALCYAQHYSENNIAELTTFGTSNLGAIKADFFSDDLLEYVVKALDIKSEAVRDLAYW